MTPVIYGQEMVTLGEVVERGEPIECARGSEAVEQHQRGCARGPRILDHTHAPAAFQIEKELLPLGG
jgi:hypothetical protein